MNENLGVKGLLGPVVHDPRSYESTGLWEEPTLQTAPFLRWAGGKRWLLNHLSLLQPNSYVRYFEPFLGSGALLLSVPPEVQRFGSDSNSELINAFVAVRDCPEQVIQKIAAFGDQKSDYLALRESYNSDDFELNNDPSWRAAVFIYLNRTSFNGLYRVNQLGKFNVPWGNLKKPLEKIPAHIRGTSKNLNSGKSPHEMTRFEVSDYKSVLAQASDGDWVFLDPPYAPLSPTSDFVGYTTSGFTDTDQRELRDLALDSARRGAKVMISNSDTELTRRLYRDAPFRIREFLVSRRIGASASSRSPVKELIVTTYG